MHIWGPPLGAGDRLGGELLPRYCRQLGCSSFLAWQHVGASPVGINQPVSGWLMHTSRIQATTRNTSFVT